DVACDAGFNNIHRGSNDDQYTLRISGANSDLTATLNDHEMIGNGNDDRLALSGTFPVRDDDGTDAPAIDRETHISITLDDVVDANEAHGVVEGDFQGRFGFDCTISNGQAVFTR
ncbi:MAG: hypothetical protein KC620_23635, partial [Myxococcales bacterium]|nr:hypothetical protein [Myxococcales bacterium]